MKNLQNSIMLKIVEKLEYMKSSFMKENSKKDVSIMIFHY